jgi:hypothetical protein
MFDNALFRRMTESSTSDGGNYSNFDIDSRCFLAAFLHGQHRRFAKHIPRPFLSDDLMC